MIIVLTILFFVISLLLMVVVLIQPGSSGGLGFFGGGSQSAFGTRTGNVLTRFTTVLAGLFLIVSFVLGYLNSRQSRVDTKEIMDIQKGVEQSSEEVQTDKQIGVELGVDISDTKE